MFGSLFLLLSYCFVKHCDKKQLKGFFPQAAGKIEDVQTKCTYEKQPTVFQNKKRVLLWEHASKTPLVLKKKPSRLQDAQGEHLRRQEMRLTGNVTTWGQILSGVVTKMKIQRTIVIDQDYLHYIWKFNCFEKSHKNMYFTCHSVSGMYKLATLSRWESAD